MAPIDYNIQPTQAQLRSVSSPTQRVRLSENISQQQAQIEEQTRRYEQEYQQQAQQQQAIQEDYNKWQTAFELASKVKRGKPFALYDVPTEIKDRVQTILQGNAPSDVQSAFKKLGQSITFSGAAKENLQPYQLMSIDPNFEVVSVPYSSAYGEGVDVVRKQTVQPYQQMSLSSDYDVVEVPYSSQYGEGVNVQLKPELVKEASVVSMPSTARDIQAIIREKTGVSIPTPRQVYQNILRSGQSEEDVYDPITTKRALRDVARTAYSDIPQSFASGVDILGGELRGGAEDLGISSYTFKSSGSVPVAKKETINIMDSNQLYLPTESEFTISGPGLIGAIPSAAVYSSGVATAAYGLGKFEQTKQPGYLLLAASPALLKYAPKALGTELIISRETGMIPKIKAGTMIGDVSEIAKIAEVSRIKYPLIGYERGAGYFGRTIAETRGPARRLFGLGPKTIYEGIPYGKVGTKSYKKTLGILEDFGIKEKVGRKLLRYQQPRVAEQISKGIGKAYFGANVENPIIISSETVTRPKIIDLGQGIKTRRFQATKTYINQPGRLVKDKAGTELYAALPESKKVFLTSKGREYMKLSQRGRTAELESQLSAVKFNREFDINIPTQRSMFVNPPSVFSKLNLGGDRGLYYATTNEIALKSSLPKVIKTDVLAHELGHAFAFERGLMTNKIQSQILKEVKSSSYYKALSPYYRRDLISAEALADIFALKKGRLIRGRPIPNSPTAELLLKNELNKPGILVSKPAKVKVYEESSLTTGLIPKRRKVYVSDSTIYQIDTGRQPNIIELEPPKSSITITKIDQANKGFTNLKPKEDFITVYHATSSKNVPSILDKGLQPSKKTGIYQGVAEPLPYVSTGTTSDVVGFGMRSVNKQGGQVTILEAKIPKSAVDNLIIKSDKISGVNEIRFKEIPKEYIKVYEPKITPQMAEQVREVNRIAPRLGLATPEIKIQKPLKMPTIIQPSPTAREIEAPKMVGGLGLGRSEFYGAGTYERTEAVQLLAPVTKAVVISQLGERLKPVEKTGEKLFFAPALRFDSRLAPAERLSPIQAITPVERLIVKQSTRLTVRPAMKTPTKLRPPRIIPKVIPPKIRVPFPDLPSRKKEKLRVKGTSELFIPLVRRYGKFTAVGKPTTAPRAIATGLAKVRGTLGASLQIKGAKTGRLLKFSKTSAEFGLGSSGRDVTTLVQRKTAPGGGRLKYIPERQEIQALRNRRVRFI